MGRTNNPADRLMPVLVGGVISWIDVALLALFIWVLWSAINRPNVVDAGVIALCAGLLIVGTFCALVGFRLFLNRPNKYGSILSPVGWRVLGALFAAVMVAAFGLFITTTATLPPLPLLIASADGLGLFSCDCFYMARTVKRPDSDAL